MHSPERGRMQLHTMSAGLPRQCFFSPRKKFLIEYMSYYYKKLMQENVKEKVKIMYKLLSQKQSLIDCEVSSNAFHMPARLLSRVPLKLEQQRGWQRDGTEKFYGFFSVYVCVV